MTLTIAYLIPMHENNTASKGDLILECYPNLKRNYMYEITAAHLFENMTKLRIPSVIKLPLPCTIGQNNFLYMH